MDTVTDADPGKCHGCIHVPGNHDDRDDDENAHGHRAHAAADSGNTRFSGGFESLGCVRREYVSANNLKSDQHPGNET
ncbi:MAG: hypothetical protein WKF77_27800 [Planctomycetaceae bacterium]